jgi:hypothetical protein
MKLLSYIVIYGTLEVEVFLHLSLLKVVDPVVPCNMMICRDSKLMRVHLKLPNQNLESMHPVSKCICGILRACIQCLKEYFSLSPL